MPAYFSPRRSRDSFTLIEVVIALGIATFAILAMIALLPAGAASTKSSIDESVALNILSEVIADRKATPLTSVSTIYQIPSSATMSSYTSPTTQYSFSILDNNTYSSTPTAGRYRVDCVFTLPVAGTLGPYLGDFRVSWPATANSTPLGSVETVVAFPQP